MNGKDVTSYRATIFFENNKMSANSSCNTATGIPFYKGENNTVSLKEDSRIAS